MRIHVTLLNPPWLASSSLSERGSGNCVVCCVCIYVLPVGHVKARELMVGGLLEPRQGQIQRKTGPLQR